MSARTANPAPIAAALAAVGVVLLAPLPFHLSGLAEQLWNLGHIPLFALVAFGIHLALPSGRKFLAPLIAAALAAAAELGQALTGRSASLADFACDLLGIGLAWLACGALRGSAWRLPTAFALLVGVGLAATPAVRLFGATRAADAAFPELADAERSSDLLFWDSTGGTAVRRADREPAGGRCIEIDFGNGSGWPGATLRHPQRDWSGYKTLSFDARAERPLTTLGIRIDGQQQHYNQLFLAAEWKSLSIALPPGENDAVSALVFFVEAGGGPLRIWLDNIRLQ